MLRHASLTLERLRLCLVAPHGVGSLLGEPLYGQKSKVRVDAFVVMQHLRIFEKKLLQFRRNGDGLRVLSRRSIGAFELETALALESRLFRRAEGLVQRNDSGFVVAEFGVRHGNETVELRQGRLQLPGCFELPKRYCEVSLLE